MVYVLVVCNTPGCGAAEEWDFTRIDETCQDAVMTVVAEGWICEEIDESSGVPQKTYCPECSLGIRKGRGLV